MNLKLNTTCKYFLALLNLMFLCTLNSHAQETKKTSFKITGTVVNKSNGNPVEFAVVKLYQETDSSLVAGTLADSLGNFVIKPKNNGVYYIEITLIGFEAKTIRSIAITSEKPRVELGEIDLITSSRNIKNVEIYANHNFRIDIDKKIYAVDSILSKTNGTAGDVLQNIPSVFVNQDGSVSLRGGKVRIYINGKPSSIFGISRSQVLDYIPANMIESVEVINEPSSKYDAEGSAGIINIVLKTNRARGFNAIVSGSVGTRNKYNGSIVTNYNFKKLNLFASYDRRQFEIFATEDKNRETDISNSAKYVDQTRDHLSNKLSQNVRLRAEYYLNKNNILNVTYLNTFVHDVDSILLNYSHFNNIHKLSKLYNRTINESQHDDAQNIAINYTKKFKTPQQLLSFDVLYSKGKENTDGRIQQNFYNLDSTPSTNFPLLLNTLKTNKEISKTIQVDYTHPFRNKAKMEVGAKIRKRETSLDYLLENYDYPSSQYYSDTAISNNFYYHQQVSSGYVTYRNKMNLFSYKIGVRAEQTNIDFKLGNNTSSTNLNYINFFPSAYFLFDLDKNTKLSVKYSRRIDRPNFSEISPLQEYNDPIFINKGNPNLLPEFTHSFDVTTTKNWRKNALSGSVYYRNGKNTIQKVILLDTLGVTYMNYQNLKNSQHVGIEAVLFYHLTPWWRINSSLNIYRSIMDGSNIESNFKSDNYSSNYKLSSNVSLWKGASLLITGNYQSPTYSPLIKNFGQYYLDAYCKQNFLKNRLTLSFRVTDLLHTQRRIIEMESSNYYIYSKSTKQSRIFYVGLTYRFRNNKKLNEPEEETDENSQTDNN